MSIITELELKFIFLPGPDFIVFTFIFGLVSTLVENFIRSMFSNFLGSIIEETVGSGNIVGDIMGNIIFSVTEDVARNFLGK